MKYTSWALVLIVMVGLGEAQEKKRGSVVLGTPRLTAGIPGKNDLTIDEIKSWLETKANHVPLNVTLPQGLALGANNISIPSDNPMTRAKIELGRQLFFDTRLSADNTVSCASCHNPEDGYGRNTTFGVGIKGQKGGRNSPISFNRILSSVQFWDGRAATLEEVVEWYNKGGHPNPYLSDKMKKLNLTAQEKEDVVAYMQALQGPLPNVRTDRLPK